MNGSLTFKCSICGESSTKICLYCTHDTCENHLCERCGCCSDCCSCIAHRQDTDQVAAISLNHHVDHADEAISPVIPENPL